MISSARLLSFTLISASLFLTIQASEPIRMASYPALSPDGSTLLFSWHGDIWSAAASGGKATRLTTHPGLDFTPKFTPDGKSICFGSTRAGSHQVFIKSAQGGTARQITHHSEGTFLEDIAPDGKSILARGLRDYTGRRPYRLYSIQLDGKTPEHLLFNARAKNGRYAPDGESILFTRNGSPTYRKGYNGTQASQVWIWNKKAASGSAEEFQQPVSSPFGCRSPFYSSDGAKIFYTLGSDNGYNLWTYNTEEKTNEQITFFDDDSVFHPSVSRNGSALVFRHLFDLYRLPLTTTSSDVSPAQPEKIVLWHEEDLNEKETQDRVIKKTSDINFSPSGLEITFTADGDIWAMDTILRKPHRLTNTEGYEKDLWFSHDGKSIFYIYDDGIDKEIRQLKKNDPKQFWWEADQCEHSVVVPADKQPTSITPGPKGKKIAYTTYPADLWVSKVNGHAPVRLLQSWDQVSVQWSPDGQWLTYAVQDDNFNPDIFIIKADGNSAPVNISSHPNLDFNPVWSPNGRRLAFVGKHHKNEFDIFYVELFEKDDVEDSDGKTREKARKAMLNDPTYKSDDKEEGLTTKTVKKAIKTLMKGKGEDGDKKKAPKEEFDLKNIHQRVHRLPLKGITPTKLIWSHDSKSILYQISKGKSLYSIEVKKGAKPLKLADAIGTPIKMSTKGKLYWLSKNVPAVFAKKKNTSYPFSIYTSRDRTAWKRMVFRTGWSTMRDQFYDPSMNGRDWNAVRAKYEEMATQAPDSQTLDRIVNMMLGELNASHMGYSGNPWPNTWKHQTQWKEETAHLGVRFDEKHTGKGWKVASVIPYSPADQKISQLNPDDIILKVGGQEVLATTPITARLNLRPNEPVLLTVANSKGEERTVKIQPINYTAARTLIKKSNITSTAEQVDQLSGGKLGYIHVARMMWDEFEQFQQHLYQQGVGKDALIIDVRDNGGGFTTDHLLTALCQPDHAFTMPRNGGIGYPQDRTVYATWSKPILVLCNQNSFSNAEIFAHAIRNLNRGKIVGVATAGGVISTGAKPILDAGTMRLPFRGWFSSKDGKDLELNGAEPHITIWNQPGERSRGKDIQLEKAVQILLEESKKALGLPKPIYRNKL